MWRVIVHVKHQRQQSGVDVEVPAEIPLQHLAGLLTEALHWNDSSANQQANYIVREMFSGKSLSLQSSLAELGLWDGTHLLFEPIINNEPLTDPRVQPAFLVSQSGHRYSLIYPVHRLGRSSSSGRSDTNLIDLRPEPQSQTVSRHHADICYEQGNWILRCLPNVRNPTLCNNVPLAPSQSYSLVDGDWIQLAAVKLRFQTPAKQEGPDA